MALGFSAMARKSKKARPPTQIRSILAKNVRYLRDLRFGHMERVTARNKALAELVECSPTQIQRICMQLDDKTGCSIDYVEWVADALGVLPQNLLTPNFRLQEETPASDSNTKERSRKSPSGGTAAELQRKSG